jgi:hypothetical protein
MVSAGSGIANAQTANKDKKAGKTEAIRHKIESKHYTFIANYVSPMRGGQKQLTSLYDLRVTPDSVISFLPYFGRAYFDIPYNPTDAGIKFTSTKFDYKVANKKNGGWEITISPKDVKNLERMILYISSDGYASMSVSSVNRDFISYDGYLK